MEKVALYILSLALVSNISFSQNDIRDYFLKNSLTLNDSIKPNKVDSLELFNYNGYFFGEDHTSPEGPYKEIAVINILQKTVKNIFIEYPIGYNIGAQQYLQYHPIDTTTNDFKFYAGDNKPIEVLLRYIYLQNRFENASLKASYIDMNNINYAIIDDLLYFLKRKFKPKSVKTGLQYLKVIKKDSTRFGSQDSLIHQVMLLRENFYTNLLSYRSYLKKDFTEFKNDIDGIYVYSLARKEDTTECACSSNSREEFMFSNIMDLLKKDSVKKFISINGAAHTILDMKGDWQYINGYESLAEKIKRSNKDLKICNIYFMDHSIDVFGETYFPEEKKLIFENIKPGETYLIRLDGENTPFKDLSEKFKYIVAW